MLTLHGVDDLWALVGQELGTSDWHTVTQERINAFAAATDDFEPLHLDPERARRTPFGVTIAHGLYTLSLGPKFLYQIYSIDGISLWLNYGYEKVRWISPVLVNSRLRMRAVLAEARPITGGTRFTIDETFEVEGQSKPACVARALAAYYD